MAENFYFLAHFIRFQDSLFFEDIFWIFLSKDNIFVFLVAPLNSFQSATNLDVR